MAAVIPLQNGRLLPIERRLFAHARCCDAAFRNREIILPGFVAGPAFPKQRVIARSTARCRAIQHRAKLLIGKN
jgi:hypothetical protein